MPLPPCGGWARTTWSNCLPTYAKAAEEIAAEEVGAVVKRQEPARMVEGVVIGTIVGEALFNALRRLAQQDASARLLLTPEALATLADTQHGARSSPQSPVTAGFP